MGERTVLPNLLWKVGAWGAAFSLVGFLGNEDFATLERFERAPHNDLNYLLYFGYGTVGFLNYSLSLLFVKLAGASAYNLNGLTNTLWSMLVDILLFNKAFKWLTVVGYVIVILGVLLFHSRKPS